MLGDSYGGYDYPTWKWRSLEQRRSFIFPVISIFLLIVWMYIISHGSSHCEKDPDHSPCSNPYKFFLIGIAAFFLTFHFLFSFATVFSRWGIELLSSETMGRRLCILSELSWVFLLYLTTNGVVDWLISDFERGFFISLLNALGLSLFHHTGLAQRDLLWMIAGIILGWIRLVKYQTNELVFMWIFSLMFCLFTMFMQEAEFKRYFEFLKNTAVERKSSLGEEEFRDIVSSVEALLGIISKLEYDVRDRIKKSLMTGPKKRGVANMIENPIRTYHSGCLYQIETLSKAITISLLNDASAVLPIPCSEKDETKTLSHLCATLFRAFEDSVSPRMVPLFYDRNAGDVEFIDLSPTLLQTILFLVLFDAVASNSPGFCNVSFEQPGYLPVILRFTALDSLQSLRLVITKVTASSGSDKKDWRNSQKAIDVPNAMEGTDQNILKQLLPVQNIGNGNMPQVWLADRLVRHHLKSRIVACGPEVKSGLSTYTWTIDLSNQIFQSTKNAVDLEDAKGSSYTWKIFERFEEKKQTNDSRTGKTTKFKGELNALKVNYIVCLIEPLGRYDSEPLKCSKIGVVHEHDLLHLEDREIEYILSAIVDLIVLADEDVQRYDSSYFFGKYPVTFSRKEWSPDFRRALRMRVSSEISASRFFDVFKNARRSNRLDLKSGVSSSPNELKTIIYPTLTASKKNQEYEELNGLILKKQVSKNPSRLEERIRPDNTAQSDGEPISYSKLWHIVIAEWEGHGLPKFRRIITECHRPSSDTGDSKLSLAIQKKVNFIDFTCKTLENSACLNFETLNKIKAHALVRDADTDSVNNRAMYFYLVQYYAKPLAIIHTLIDLFLAFTCDRDHHYDDSECRIFYQEIRLNLQYLIERTAYDDMDFLNLWFQVIQAMISEVFIDHIGEILEYVIPNMLNIAENFIWGIPEIMESSWINLFEEG